MALTPQRYCPVQHVCCRSQDAAAVTVLPHVPTAATLGPGSPCATCAAHWVQDPAGCKVLRWVFCRSECTFSFVLSPLETPISCFYSHSDSTLPGTAGRAGVFITVPPSSVLSQVSRNRAPFPNVSHGCTSDAASSGAEAADSG